jgi:uncharacterized protein (DUF362 family)
MNRRLFLKTAAGIAAGSILGLGSSFIHWKRNILPKRSQVALVKTGEGGYDQELKGHIHEVFDLLGGIGKVFPERGSVLIKPNLVEPRPPSEGLTTHPRVVEALIEVLREQGFGEIAIGEGSGLERDFEYLLQQTGFHDIGAKYGVKIHNLNHEVPVKVEVPDPLVLPEVYLPRIIFEYDYIISVPKMKTHRGAVVSLGMKNLFGLLPGAVYGYPKNLLHRKGIFQCIADINSVVRPDFVLVDGIIGMEGHGPIFGTPKDIGLLVGGKDPLATDATAARAMGFDPQEIPPFQYSHLKGLGNLDEEDISIRGEGLEDVTMYFERPENLKGIL